MHRAVAQICCISDCSFLSLASFIPAHAQGKPVPVTVVVTALGPKYTPTAGSPAWMTLMCSRARIKGRVRSRFHFRAR